jgi:hypothetical protein
MVTIQTAHATEEWTEAEKIKAIDAFSYLLDSFRSDAGVKYAHVKPTRRGIVGLVNNIEMVIAQGITIEEYLQFGPNPTRLLVPT